MYDDSLRATEDKMEQWIANGAQLGWLIDPRKRQIHIYEPGKAPRRKAARSSRGAAR
ncbi:MAG: Uma2 family endonuclease [Silvibacterium sp.]|nr:Uma2 family endonuclease [Silvibacterium sp.]